MLSVSDISVFLTFQMGKLWIKARLAQFGAVVYFGGAQWMVALVFVQLQTGQGIWLIKLIPCLGGIFSAW